MGSYFVHGIEWVYENSRLGVYIDGRRLMLVLLDGVQQRRASRKPWLWAAYLGAELLQGPGLSSPDTLWGFPKLRGPICGVSIIRIRTCWGPY